MELSSAGLQGDDGTEGGPVTQELPRYIDINRLGLEEVSRHTILPCVVILEGTKKLSLYLHFFWFFLHKYAHNMSIKYK